jgi:16S rRNA (guanine966-N2)-methyltransferase
VTLRANEIRIIGGRWRRRKLPVPVAPGVRPTPDRVRETLFNWLGQDLTGRICLDVFAGSGALGFEALSRGAERVVAVERERRTVDALRRVALALGAAAYELHHADATEFLAREPRTFDVIFVDPPFELDWLPRGWPLLLPRLRPSGYLYVEAPGPVEPPADEWTVVRRDRAGNVHYHLLHRNINPSGR